MAGAGQPLPWHGRTAWCVLDTDFSNPRRFLALWQRWCADRQRPRMLHYVAICPTAPDLNSFVAELAHHSLLLPHTQTLQRQWYGFLPGFHRIQLSGGQVLLTICVGEVRRVLRELHFVADQIDFGGLETPTGAAIAPETIEPPSYTVKALARCCARGTRLLIDAPTQSAARLSTWRDELAAQGFEPEVEDAASLDSPPAAWRYNPRWTISNTRGSRAASSSELPAPSHCVVIGAGLAGASVAASLARRGWQVQVLDAAPTPAAGASALPAGLAAPHNSPDDSPRSRLSRAGLRLTLEQAQRDLVAGSDFDACGVLERRGADGSALPKNWPTEGQDWSQLRADQDSLWHPHAGWIKPASLVQTWFQEPGVQFVPSACVHRITTTKGGWALHSKSGDILAVAPLVVLAAAGGSISLLGGTHPLPRRLATLHGMAGQVSWGVHQDGDAAHFPATPVNGAGSFIPAVPMGKGIAWLAGATYVPAQETPTHLQHQENFARLNTLLPECAARLRPRLGSHGVQAWRGVRCASSDRLPVVDEVWRAQSPGLWVCTALGSRGLSLSVLCAELLAARLHGEPLPLERRLARLLEAG